MPSHSDATTDPDIARERIADLLRSAIGAPEEEALEDATRRLMLQLSIDPPEAHRLSAAPAPAPKKPDKAARPRLLRRLLRKPRRRGSA